MAHSDKNNLTQNITHRHIKVQPQPQPQPQSKKQNILTHNCSKDDLLFASMRLKLCQQYLFDYETHQ